MKHTPALLLAGYLLLSLAACEAGTAGPTATAEGPAPLTREELRRANEAFASTVAVTVGGVTTVSASEISCFFTSHYASPSELDLEEFLRYCPANDILADADAEEYRAAATALGLDTGQFPLPSDGPVPVHRYRAEDVSALLQTYAGITVVALSNTEGTVYLEEYDAYYNGTSDFGPGVFSAERGVRDGDTVRFTSAPFGDGSADELTLKKVGETYYIQSFLNLPEGGS